MSSVPDKNDEAICPYADPGMKSLWLENRRLERQLSAIAPNVIELLRVAQCPACDGSGAIPHQIGEGDWELQQCQWCDERQQAIGPSDGGGA